MFCKKCGNELPEEAKFCGKCGSKVMQSDNLNNNESKKNKSKLWKIIIIIIIFAYFTINGSLDVPIPPLISVSAFKFITGLTPIVLFTP